MAAKQRRNTGNQNLNEGSTQMEGATGEQGITRASEATPPTGETGGQKKTVRRRRSPSAKHIIAGMRGSGKTPHIGNNTGSPNWGSAFGGLQRFLSICGQAGLTKQQIMSEVENYATGTGVVSGRPRA